MENTVRTTHNLAAVLLETSARLNHKADTIAENVEYRGPSPLCSEKLPNAPATAANDVMNRAIDNLLALENTLDRIHESVGQSALSEIKNQTAAATESKPSQRAVTQSRY